MAVYINHWQGKLYCSSPYQGVRLLVLGESQYEWLRNTPLTSTSTIDLIQECIDEGGDVHPKKFWSKIAYAVLGHAPSSDQFCDFWQSVAFYNYIQESVGFRATGNRPTSAQWKAAAAPFHEVLDNLKPDCILVLGQTLWRRMSEAGHNGPSLTYGGKDRYTWLYPTGSNTAALASQILHPSARSHWDPADWHPWISALMKEASALTLPIKCAEIF